MLNVGWMVQLQRIARFWFAPHSRTTHSSMSIWRANASGTDGLSLSKNETKKKNRCPSPEVDCVCPCSRGRNVVCFSVNVKHLS